ncbi:MAG TPA: O-antigen ligase family protein [Gaiellaceae bacterium]|nr:O-antigen ligase family protein [Gaiellaceae bacterium]
MRTGALALLATAGVLLAASLLFGGGSSVGPVSWIGTGAVLAAVAACGAALWGILPAPALGREGLAFACLAGGFVAWNGVTILWSAAPDRSWEYFNRGLVYLAFAVVGAFVGSAVAPRSVVWVVGGLIGATSLWALLEKAVPALYGDYGRLARLRSPVGYWNALALVVVFGLAPALWAATRPRSSRGVKAGAAVLLYSLIVALVLTYSRGGVLAALVALGLWFALTRERFDSLAALVTAAAPAGAVLALALALPGIAQDGQPRSVRVQDGAVFALAFVLGAGIAFAAAFFARERPSPERQRLLLRVAAGATAALLVVAVGVIASRGNPLKSQDVVQTPSRFSEGSLNNRWGWWKEAWHAFEEQPLRGTGAGSFEVVHKKLRTSNVSVREVHDLPLQFASETGLVGLLLAAGAAGAALLGARRALRRLDREGQAAAVALGVALPTFLVHGAFDYDWEFVALCGPLFFVTGVLLATGRKPTRVRHPVWALALVLVAWAGLYSIAAPRFAAARVNDAYSEIERGSVEQAVADAKSAHSLDPLSIDPLEAWASAEESRGHIARARELYAQAVELQPLSSDAWYELGRFDQEVLGDDVAATRELTRAVELDPHGCQARRALGQTCEG